MGKDTVKGHVEFSEAQGNVFDEAGLGWYSYVKDQVGTITQVYSRENYSMTETRTYDVFGNLINKTGSSNGNLGFQGKYYDQESGLYYYYHRYYYPTIGRFINEDPIGLSGGMNLFRFGINNPINKSDPFGLITLSEKQRKEWRKSWTKMGMSFVSKLDQSLGQKVNQIPDWMSDHFIEFYLKDPVIEGMGELINYSLEGLSNLDYCCLLRSAFLAAGTVFLSGKGSQYFSIFYELSGFAAGGSFMYFFTQSLNKITPYLAGIYWAALTMEIYNKICKK